MLQRHWTKTTITTNQEANAMLKLFDTLCPHIGAFDTETTGLHITLDIPFLFQFGFLDPNSNEGYSYVVDIQRQPLLANAVINEWHKRAETLDKYLAHNVKFDLHMLANNETPYLKENLSDTMFYIRYGHDAIQVQHGGPPLKLKDYATRYVDHNAKLWEKELDKEKSAIAKSLNLRLKTRLSSCGAPPAKYNARSYTLSVIQEMFKDPIFAVEDLPDNIKQAYIAWLHEDVPIYIQPKVTDLIEPDQIPYHTLNRATLIEYAHYDIIYVLETYLKLQPIVEYRQNEYAVEVEEKNILPLYEMERTGFKVNKDYLINAQQHIKEYIKKRRQDFYTLINREIKTGQHEAIKKILNEDFDCAITTTNAEELNKVHSDLIREGTNPEAVALIEVLQELRTLEKWYSVYIMRFLKSLKDTDRLYAQISQVGAVSGRVTSDFQQFPKDPIITIDGEELFHPRKMIIPTGGDYNSIVYLDYSQIELRLQALYTILVGNPDLNLCRAYMPYKCIHPSLGLFDYNNPEHIKRWEEAWVLEEDPETLWTPTDVHGKTTTEATGLHPGDLDFDHARGTIGKRTNFAKNYGAKLGRIMQMFPNKTKEECIRIDGAYYLAFPGVKTYHQYCYNRAMEYPCTANLFGVKYYGASGHKLINILVQGSAATLLKLKMREVYDYLKTNNLKTRYILNVHDELQFERHKDDPIETIFDLKHILEKWDDTLVPIVADVEVTTTNWAEKKKGGDTIDALRIHLST